MRRRTLITMLALVVTACGGDGAPSNLQRTVNRVTPQESGARLAALPEAQRDATFYRAIHDAGLPCDHVRGSTPAQPYHNMPVWMATCRGGSTWTLVVGPDEIVQVLNPNEARLIRGQSGNRQ